MTLWRKINWTPIVIVLLFSGMLGGANHLSVRNQRPDSANYITGVSIGSQQKSYNLAITTSTVTSQDFGFRHHRSVAIRRMPGETIATVTIYFKANGDSTSADYDATETWVQMKDEDAVLIGSIDLTDDLWHEVNTSAFPMGAILLVGDVAGTVRLSMKG